MPRGMYTLSFFCGGHWRPQGIDELASMIARLDEVRKIEEILGQHQQAGDTQYSCSHAMDA